MKGKNKEGKPIWMYLGVHLHNLLKLFNGIEYPKEINPNDFNARVLGYSDGEEPDEELRAFMEEHYSFSDQGVVLEFVPSIPE
jgi:hypothetical protein